MWHSSPTIDSSSPDVPAIINSRRHIAQRLPERPQSSLRLRAEIAIEPYCHLTCSISTMSPNGHARASLGSSLRWSAGVSAVGGSCSAMQERNVSNHGPDGLGADRGAKPREDCRGATRDTTLGIVPDGASVAVVGTRRGAVPRGAARLGRDVLGADGRYWGVTSLPRRRLAGKGLRAPPRAGVSAAAVARGMGGRWAAGRSADTGAAAAAAVDTDGAGEESVDTSDEMAGLRDGRGAPR